MSLSPSFPRKMNRIPAKCLLGGLALALFAVFPVGSQVFFPVDLQKSIRDHPLTSRFDRKTGRFIGTESAYKDIASLSERLEDLKKEIGKSKSDQEELSNSVFSGKVDQENFWKKTRGLREKAEKTRSEILEIESLLMQGKETPDRSILPMIAEIASDVIGEIPDNGVALNSLPPYPPETESPETIPVRNPWLWFGWTKNRDEVRRYLSKPGRVGRLFRRSRDPILFQKTNEGERR